MALVLLSTVACHLCENAQALLMQLHNRMTVDVFIEDIGESADLVDKYGLRIPVLLHEESGAELGWPFDAQQLSEWLIQYQCLNPTNQ